MNDPLAITQRWVAQFVVALQLCPFAEHPLREGKIRYALSEAAGPEALWRDFLTEWRHLIATPANELETTLLVHPGALSDFEDYLDFVAAAEQALAEEVTGNLVQVAGFHPDYHFAEAPVHDPANYTNRAPYPMLHLIRADRLEAALLTFPEAGAVPERNAQLLRQMGEAEILHRLAAIQRG